MDHKGRYSVAVPSCIAMSAGFMIFVDISFATIARYITKIFVKAHRMYVLIILVASLPRQSSFALQMLTSDRPYTDTPSCLRRHFNHPV